MLLCPTNRNQACRIRGNAAVYYRRGRKQHLLVVVVVGGAHARLIVSGFHQQVLRTFGVLAVLYYHHQPTTTTTTTTTKNLEVLSWWGWVVVLGSNVASWNIRLSPSLVPLYGCCGNNGSRLLLNCISTRILNNFEL